MAARAGGSLCHPCTALRGAGGRRGCFPGVFDRPGPASVDAGPNASTAEAIAAMRVAIENEPGDAALHATLGDLYYQRGRETANALWNEKAHGAYDRALELDPKSAQATNGLGTLALAKHDFAGGLRFAQQRWRSHRSPSGPISAIVDGRSSSAATPPRSAGSTIWSRSSRTSPPTRASPTSVSSMATSTARSRPCDSRSPPAGGSAENVAYVETLLGNLEFQVGHIARAGIAYRTALARVPAYLPAQAGLATVQAATGDLDRAIERYEAVVRKSAVHEFHLLLLEAKLADGRCGRPQGDRRNPREPGARTEQGSQHGRRARIFEADHGSAARAVAFGRSAVRKAPSVSSADAYSWALTRAGHGQRAPLGEAGPANGLARPACPLPRRDGRGARGRRRARAQVADAGARPKPGVLAAACAACAARPSVARLEQRDGVAAADRGGQEPQQTAQEHLRQLMLHPDPEVRAGRAADPHRDPQPPDRRHVGLVPSDSSANTPHRRRRGGGARQRCRGDRRTV